MARVEAPTPLEWLRDRWDSWCAYICPSAPTWASTQGSAQMPPGFKSGPVTRVCHVCGRQYGLSSFDIHLKQCKKLWIAQEEQKPANERRPIPKTPPGLGGSTFDGGVSMSRDEIDALNRAAQETFNVHGMEKCENCGRTFAEGRLAIHNRSCRPDSVAKKVADGAAPRNRPDTEMEYGRARKGSEGAENSPIKRSTSSQPPGIESVSPQTPPTRPLTGSIASNRKRIAGSEPKSSGAGRLPIQSPLEGNISATVDAAELQEQFRGKEGLVRAIEAKLAQWEATTVATLQEIRDLKDLFAQIQ